MLMFLGWTLALSVAVILLYLLTAIAIRVLYSRGVITDPAFIEAVFAPLNYPYNHTPPFRAAFDKCVSIFGP